MKIIRPLYRLRSHSFESTHPSVEIVSSNADLGALLPALRNAAYEIDPIVPFKTPETMNDVVSDSLMLDRLQGWL